MQEFEGRVAVVTGGASGIGLALARRLAAEGMKLALADVDGKRLEAARDELAAAGSEVIAVPTDVASPEAVDALAGTTLDAFGAVHVVANNAGVAVTGPLWEGRLADMHWAFGVNFWGVIHGIRTFVPILREQGEPAHVVNTASMAALTSVPYLDVYAASKHAVLALSECLYKELALEQSPVHASVVCPGLIKTPLMKNSAEAGGSAASELGPGGALMNQYLTNGTESGWDPSLVADAIFEGIRDERFYIVPTQPELFEAVELRLSELRERRNPSIANPA
jgi:NAD(P)-dependent dehydrogenase (short-subunit alcohol dehydrogenase family)